MCLSFCKFIHSSSNSLGFLQVDIEYFNPGFGLELSLLHSSPTYMCRNSLISVFIAVCYRTEGHVFREVHFEW